MVVVDALRGDRLGCTGRPLDVSPNLDALADDGVLFQRAISQSTFTACSVASLLTGLNPHRHGLYWGSLVAGDTVSSHVLAATHHTMAEHFADQGFRTAAWVQNRVLRDELGFAQGFEVFEEVRGDKHLSSRRIVDRYLGWLAGVDANTPTFAYLHVLDLHDPYDPRSPYDTMFVEPGVSAPELETLDSTTWHAWVRQVHRGERQVSTAELAWLSARYDGIVRSIDHQVGRLIDGLRELDRYETTAIVVTADHGDGFGEHGFVSHGNVPYIELVHVPLILKMPDGAFAGRSVPHLVRQIDLLPTLLEIATGGTATSPSAIDGCSLVPFLAADDDHDSRSGPCREAVSEILLGGEHLTVAVREGSLTYLFGERLAPALFDRRSDPHELTNLAGLGHPGEKPLNRRAVEIVSSARYLPTESLPVDSQTLEQIRALGYAE